MPNRGIYILANDRVISDAVALLYSLREHAPAYPVRLIPYNDKHEKVLSILNRKFGVELFAPAETFAEIERYAAEIYGQPAPATRKLAAWTGPFDEFIYIDCDIVVLQDQKDVFDLLPDYDIIYCGSGPEHGIDYVFTDRVFDRNLFTRDELGDLFNSGFFASKKDALPYPRLLELLEEAVEVRDIFYQRLQDQPLLNYIALKTMPRRANIRLLAPQPGRPILAHPHSGRVTCDVWAGYPGLVRDGRGLRFPNGSAIRHIHWAGYRSVAHKPYLDVWLRYRYPNRLVEALARSYYWIRRNFGIARMRRVLGRVSDKLRLQHRPA